MTVFSIMAKLALTHPSSRLPRSRRRPSHWGSTKSGCTTSKDGYIGLTPAAQKPTPLQFSIGVAPIPPGHSAMLVNTIATVGDVTGNATNQSSFTNPSAPRT